MCSTLGLSGQDCSEIPFKLPPDLLLKRKIMWDKMQKKYELLEKYTMNRRSVSVKSLSTRIKNISFFCDGEMMQGIPSELPDADGSWENRKKYRKSMDLVQDWINASGHDIVHESFDQAFPAPTEQVEMSLSVSGRETASYDDLSDVTNGFQKEHNSCELFSTRRLQELGNVDSTPGCSPDDTHHKPHHVVLMTQEEQPTEQTRSVTKSLKGCSEIPDSESGMVFTSEKSSRTVSDSVICNKTPVSRKKILEPASKDTSSPREVSLRTCDQIGTPTTGECAIGKRISVSRIERALRNYNDSPAVRKEDHTVEDTKCTSKHVLENCGERSAAIYTVPRALNPTPTPHAGAECTNNLISRRRIFFSNGTEVLETSNGSICKKGNCPIIKGVPSCGKERLTHNDMTRPVKQKLWFDLLDTEDGIKNSAPNCSLLKEKPESGYSLEKDIDSCDTYVTLSRDIFLSRATAPASVMESGMGRYGRRRKTLLFSGADSEVPRTRYAHRYSKSRGAAKARVVSPDCSTTVSETETSVGNYYTVSSVKKKPALLSRTKVDLRDYSADLAVRKKRILPLDEQDSSLTTKEILKGVDCSSLLLKYKVSSEDGESLESLKRVRNGRKKQCAPAGHTVDNVVRDPHGRRMCHNENLASTVEHICDENVISGKETVQNSKSRESSVQNKEKKNFPSAPVSCSAVYEDCVEQSMEDASTVIIYPLLSCKYENEVPKIRQKLNNMFENVKDKDRGPLVNHDTGRACSNYNYRRERRAFRHKTKNRRRWSLDVIQDGVSYPDTPSQSGSDKSPASSGQEDKTCDAGSEDSTKVASRCTPSHSKTQDIINDSCDKVCSFGSQCISSRNKNSKESQQHLGTPQQFGRNKVTHLHCNFDAEGHGFEINRKGEKDMSHPSVKSDDEHTEEIVDDAILYYRQPQISSLHCEKESKRINKSFCLNSKSMSVRNASDNMVSGPSIPYEHRRRMRTVFSNASSHVATHTPRDGASKTKEDLLMTRTKRTKSLNHAARSGYPESEHYETGDTGNSTKGNGVTQREIKTETLYNFQDSHCAKYDGGNPKRVSVFSRDETSTGTSSRIGSGHSENEDVRADERSSCIFRDSLEKGYITPLHKCGKISSSYLFGYEKNYAVIVDCGKNSGVNDNKDGTTDDGERPNRTDVTMSRKRWAASLKSSFEAKQDETECNRSPDGSHIKQENLSHGRKSINNSSHLLASDHEKNENQMTDDGKFPDCENHLTRSKRGVKVHNSVRYKNSEKEDSITDNMRDTNKRNVLNKLDRGMATSSYHLIDSEHITNEGVTDKKVLFSDDGNDSKKENIFKRRKRTGTPKHHEINDDNDSNNDDDDTFFKTPKHSWFSEEEKTDITCGNRNSTSLKASRSNTPASVTNSHSQVLTRSNITQKSCRHSFKPVRFENEGTVSNVSSSDETSTGIEDLFTNSYRRKISRDAMKQFLRREKSENSLCRMTQPKLMKKRREETRECLPTGAELLGNAKTKEGRLGNVYHTENVTRERSGISFNSNSSQEMSSRNNVSRESLICSAVPVVCEAGNTVDTVVSCEETPKGIESYRKTFSGDVMEETESHNKSDSDIHKMNSKRTKKQRDKSFTSKHPGNEDEIMQHHPDGGGDDNDDSDDIIFFKTPKHSLFSEEEKTDIICGNRNSTSLKASRSNTPASVTNSHSQMLTRSNITRKSCRRSFKPVRFGNEGTVNNVSSSDETSTGIEDLFTNSYRRKISRDVMKQFLRREKSENSLCRMTQPKLMKKRREETRECLPTGAELLGNEKTKEGRLGNVYHTQNFIRERSGRSFNSNSSQEMSSRNNVSRESLICSAVPVVCEAGNTVDTVVSCEETPKGIESYRKKFSGDVMEETESHNKSDSDIHKMNSKRTKKQRDKSFTSKHPGNEDEIMQHHPDGGGDDNDDSDDIIFYKTPKHSWFSEEGKTDIICGNRNSTSLKASRSNTPASVTNSHSQMLTRSNIA